MRSPRKLTLAPRAGNGRRAGLGLAGGIAVLVLSSAVLPGGAAAEQASEPSVAAAGQLDAGGLHSCAVLAAGVRCWGFGVDGQLGYPGTDTIGDDETPAAAGPVNLVGHTATAIAAGDAYTCALLEDQTVRCWGFGGDGRLGYGNTNNVADPSTVGAVDLGPGRAVAITAGDAHTCALMEGGSVRCWGYGGGGSLQDGRLGYGNLDNVGDNETPGSVDPVKLGGVAVAIAAGGAHTCALLTDGAVRCWGQNGSGQLGYGSQYPVGDSYYDTPDTAGPVKLGGVAVAISAGGRHTCALLLGGAVRCWGQGGAGQLGYGNRSNVGDDYGETPAAFGPVKLGGAARAISAGENHTCAILDSGSVRCWGLGASGRLGYGNQDNIGDTETPNAVGPVDLGPGRTAAAISAGTSHTCARRDDGRVLCWGYGATGRLGYCNQRSIGDDETPGSVGPINLETGDGGAACPIAPASSSAPASSGPGAGPGTSPLAASSPLVSDTTAAALAAERIRARALRRCERAVSRHARVQRLRARRLTAGARAIAMGRIARRAARDRARCRHRYGRTPGRVSVLRARATGPGTILLTFGAPGTDNSQPPAARSYVIKQSLRPIRTPADFRAAHALCSGTCRFHVTRVGTTITETVTDLAHQRTYYYAIVARDNVSGRLGPRSRTIQARSS